MNIRVELFEKGKNLGGGVQIYRPQNSPPVMRIQIFKNVSDFAGVEIFQVFFQRFVIILADNSDQKIADLFLSAGSSEIFQQFLLHPNFLL